VARNGKYYLYFAANDIQSNAQLGGIGVAVADRPEGPYVDAIGRPLIGQFVNGAQPIGQTATGATTPGSAVRVACCLARRPTDGRHWRRYP
jgi:beta-xylosidase